MGQKNIILVAYYFPPHSGAGVQRPLRLVRELIDDGWGVTVISSDSSYLQEDVTLSKKIPAEAQVFYLDDSVNKIFKKINNRLLSKMLSYFAFPDRMFFWYLFNRSKIRRIIDSKIYDVCITTSGPYTSHFVGRYIKKINPDITHVIDYRDAWFNNASIKYSKFKPLFHALSYSIEKRINSGADYITTVSDPLVSDIVCDEKERISVIYNGYDSSDFVGLYPRENSKYEIFFMGSLYSERSPALFMDSILGFLDKLSPGERSQVKMTFIGDSRESYIKYIRNALPSCVEIEVQGYISHSDILSRACSASLFLLLIDDSPSTKGVVTGKVFEYLKLFAPILGIVPLDGAAAQIIKSTNSGQCFSPGETSRVIEFLLLDYRDWLNDQTRQVFLANKNYAVIESFSEKKQYLEFKKRCLR